MALDLREAGIALGRAQTRVARSVVVRTALPGLVSGNLLATARGVGETAPLLFTTPRRTLGHDPVHPWGHAPHVHEAPRPAAPQTAWAAALVLLAAVLGLSIAARVVAALTRKAR